MIFGDFDLGETFRSKSLWVCLETCYLLRCILLRNMLLKKFSAWEKPDFQEVSWMPNSLMITIVDFLFKYEMQF